MSHGLELPLAWMSWDVFTFLLAEAKQDPSHYFWGGSQNQLSRIIKHLLPFGN